MFAVLITIHIFVCIGLIISVLMQSAKGEGLAGAMGGGGGISGAVFGGRGAGSFLSKATTGLAMMFMGMCVLLTLTTGGGRTGDSVTGTSAVQQAAQQSTQTPQATTPSDVPEVSVGQGQGGDQLPVRIDPTEEQPQTQQGQQTEEKQKELGE